MPTHSIKYFVLAFALATTVSGQKIEFGAGGGLMHYKGDISPKLYLPEAQLGVGGFFRYNFSNAVSGRLNLLRGAVSGDDKNSKDPFLQARGMAFKTAISEISADVAYNFLNYNYQRKGYRNWTPYLFAGMAYYRFNPRAEPTASYKKRGMSIPFGIGVKYQIRGPWNLNAEFGTRKTFNDYLDNFNEFGVSVPRLGQSNPTSKDTYYYTNITLSYTILKVVCPD